MTNPPPENRDCGPNWSWYHVITTTYGAWLPGDSRGFRTRHHREHVEGDYKNPPPPGEFGRLEETCRDSLKHPEVTLPRRIRAKVGMGILERLEELGAIVVCVAVASRHMHVLTKMPVGRARHWMGIAKKHVWFILRDGGWAGKLWGKRGKEIKVRSRQHQLRVYHYILKHASTGAWIWKWSDKQ